MPANADAVSTSVSRPDCPDVSAIEVSSRTIVRPQAGRSIRDPGIVRAVLAVLDPGACRRKCRGGATTGMTSAVGWRTHPRNQVWRREFQRVGGPFPSMTRVARAAMRGGDMLSGKIWRPHGVSRRRTIARRASVRPRVDVPDAPLTVMDWRHGVQARKLAISLRPSFWLFSGWNWVPAMLSRPIMAVTAPP